MKNTANTEKTMKTLIFAAMIFCTSLAFGQSGVSCHKADSYTTDCKFSDGTVTETIVIDSDASSITYTPAEWKVRLAQKARANRWTPQMRVASCLSGYAHDACISVSSACNAKSAFTVTQCSQVQDFLKR